MHQDRTRNRMQIRKLWLVVKLIKYALIVSFYGLSNKYNKQVFSYAT